MRLELRINKILLQAIVTILVLVFYTEAQIVIYEKNGNNYLLSGKWAKDRGFCWVITKNNKVIFSSKDITIKDIFKEEIIVHTLINSSTSGNSIDNISPNPFYDCIVYREFNREESRFYYRSGKNGKNKPVLAGVSEKVDEITIGGSRKGKAASSFVWSPDGKKAVLSSGSRLYIFSYKNGLLKKDGEPEELENAEGGIFNPSWYGNTHIAFVIGNKPFILNVVGNKRKVKKLECKGASASALYYNIYIAPYRPNVCLVEMAASSKTNLEIHLGKITGNSLVLEEIVGPYGGSLENTRPVWSPLGNRFAYFHADRSKGGRNWYKRLSICDIDKNGKLLNKNGEIVQGNLQVFSDANICWHPSGNGVFFICQEGSKYLLAFAENSGGWKGKMLSVLDNKNNSLDEIREVAVVKQWGDNPYLILAGIPLATQIVLECLKKNLFTGNVPDPLVNELKEICSSIQFEFEGINFEDQVNKREDICMEIQKDKDLFEKEKEKVEEGIEKFRTKYNVEWLNDEINSFLNSCKQEFSKASQEYNVETCGKRIKVKLFHKKQKKKLQNYLSVKDSIMSNSNKKLTMVHKSAKDIERIWADSKKIFVELNVIKEITWSNDFVSNTIEEIRKHFRKDPELEKQFENLNSIWVYKLGFLTKIKNKIPTDMIKSFNDNYNKISNFACCKDQKAESICKRLNEVTEHRITQIYNKVKAEQTNVANSLNSVLEKTDEKDVRLQEKESLKMLDNLSKILEETNNELMVISELIEYSNKEANKEFICFKKVDNLVYNNEKCIEKWKKVSEIADKFKENGDFKSWSWDDLKQLIYEICILQQEDVKIKNINEEMEKWFASADFKDDKKNDDKFNKFRKNWEKIIIKGNIDELKKEVSKAREISFSIKNIPDYNKLPCSKCRNIKPGAKCK